MTGRVRNPSGATARSGGRAESDISVVQAARKVISLVSHSERKRVLLLIPMITFMALMQVVGIASVTPFLALVSNPATIEESGILSATYDFLGFQSYDSFLMFAGFGALTLLLVSNSIAALTEWMLLRFSWNFNHALSKRILESYLHKPYVFFLNNNTARLGKNLLSEVRQIVKSFVVSGMKLIANTFVVIFILILLITVNPLLALIAFGTLGGAYGLIFLGVRKRLSSIGNKRSYYDRERYKAANEALAGAKEIKLLGKQRAFLAHYNTPSKRYSRYMAGHQVISTVPRFALETIAFGGMILIVLYLIGSGQSLANIITLLGLYAFASYRLMPALQAIFKASADMRFSASAVDLIYNDIVEKDGKLPPDRDTVQPMPLQHRIELRGITFGYPNSSSVVHDVDLAIPKNSSVALVGATGSGKTTIIDIILGLLEPQSGQLLIDDVRVTPENLPNWQANLGYVPQDIYLADDTIANNIAFGVADEEVDMDAVERAARLANIHDFILSELPDGYETVTGERGARLSGGQRQRLGIARALYPDPSVLVLDEATSSLDGATEESIFSAVKEIGKTKTVIMIAHRLTTVRECDLIYLLKHGKVIASGRYEALLSNNAEFRRLANMNRPLEEEPVAQGTS